MSACETKNTNSNSNMMVESEVFNRYLKARDRVQTKAKEYYENLNKKALDQVKHQKLSEKYQRDMNT